MPMTTTHALLPLAVAVAVVRRPVPWKLIGVTMIAAAAPDIDGLTKHLFHLPVTSIYAHRGAAHSLFVALAAGLVAALFHKPIGVRPLVAGVLVAAAMASHGLLDMMTDGGLPVAYLWPVSSVRLFADWRWIQSSPVHLHHNLLRSASVRLLGDLTQLVVPMFALALAFRAGRALSQRKVSR
jgi:inner membrane protein